MRLYIQIGYKTAKLEKICTNAREAEKKYGRQMAEKIILRVWQISAEDTVERMIRDGIGRCHLLKGRREGEYAVDLVHPYRLVFEKKGDIVQIARIMEIVDYH